MGTWTSICRYGSASKTRTSSSRSRSVAARSTYWPTDALNEAVMAARLLRVGPGVQFRQRCITWDRCAITDLTKSERGAVVDLGRPVGDPTGRLVEASGPKVG